MKMAVCLLTFLLANAESKPLEKVLTQLRTAEGFHSELSKKVHEGVMERDSESSGVIYFSKGKMRLEIKKPEKLLIVYDGEFAWQEQEFDDGETKTAMVTKMNAKNLKKDSAVLAALLGDKNLLKDFGIQSQKETKGVKKYVLKPKSKKISEVVSLTIEVKKGVLSQVSYIDSLQNEVSFIFKNLKEEKLSEKKFQYRPPRGAEVTAL